MGRLCGEVMQRRKCEAVNEMEPCGLPRVQGTAEVKGVGVSGVLQEVFPPYSASPQKLSLPRLGGLFHLTPFVLKLMLCDADTGLNTLGTDTLLTEGSLISKNYKCNSEGEKAASWSLLSHSNSANETVFLLLLLLIQKLLCALQRLVYTPAVCLFLINLHILTGLFLPSN